MSMDNKMYKEIVKEEFEFLESDYGFKFSKLMFGSVFSAKRGNIVVEFIHEISMKNTYIEIKLKGDLGHKATDKKDMRTLGLGQLIMVLTEKAKLNNYRGNKKKSLITSQDYKERFQQVKPWMVKYCDKLFRENDLKNWKKTVDYLTQM